MKYEFLPHPAELRFRIYGKTLEELFSNAAEAMARVLCSKSKIQNQKSKIKIKVESIDINSLLVDFLSEILARSQINKCVYFISDIKISCQLSVVSCRLEAGLRGYPVEHFDEDIKAVTYQDLDIKKIDGVWQTILVFDV